MNKCVSQEIDNHDAQLQEQGDYSAKGNSSTIDLVLTTHMAENGARKTQAMDGTFDKG